MSDVALILGHKFEFKLNILMQQEEEKIGGRDIWKWGMGGQQV